MYGFRVEMFKSDTSVHLTWAGNFELSLFIMLIRHYTGPRQLIRKYRYMKYISLAPDPMFLVCIFSFFGRDTNLKQLTYAPCVKKWVIIQPVLTCELGIKSQLKYM